MNRHLNYFYPYSADASHENQLTRSFLALVRLVPAVQQLFFEYIRSQQKKGCSCTLPPYFELQGLEVDTQRGKLPAEGWDKLIAILMTTEDVFPGKVKPRKGGGVYDGILLTSPYVLTIENKPKYAGGQEQLHPRLPDDLGDEVIIDPSPVILVWDRLLAKVIWLLESPSLGYAERALVTDFLDLIQEKFPKLSPFTNYSICGRRREPIYRRSRSILEELTPGLVGDAEMPYAPLDSEVAIRAYLGGVPKEGLCTAIRLDIYPGDLKSQAEVFFDRAKVKALQGLVERGWEFSPNFHLSQRSVHLEWVGSTMDVFDYLKYWKADRSRFSQWKREGKWKDRARQWIDDGLFEEEQLDQLTYQFRETKRTTLNICPGFRMSWSWPIEEAEKLDRDGGFVQSVRTRLAEALPAWGDSINSALNGHPK